MKRDVRFAVRVVLNPAQYESLEFCLDETVHLDDSHDVVAERRRLVERVKSVVEAQVLEARRDIEAARSGAAVKRRKTTREE